MESRTCIICGNEFYSYNAAKKTCSKECGEKREKERKREYWRESRAVKVRKKSALSIPEMIRLLNIYNAHMHPVSYGKLVQMLDRKEVTKIDIERMAENATGNRVLSYPAIGQHVAAE